jgi:hypothetical protein
MNFKEFLNLMLGIRFGTSDQNPRIRRVKKKKTDNLQEDSLPAGKMPSLLRSIVIIVTWAIVLTSLISLGAIIYLSIVGIEIPETLTTVLIGTLGYLGGVLTAFISFATSVEE